VARSLRETGKGMTKVNSPMDQVRALQRALYVAAKRNGRRKFTGLGVHRLSGMVRYGQPATATP
jgi:hypothetical protein